LHPFNGPVTAHVVGSGGNIPGNPLGQIIMREHYTPPRHHRLAFRAQAVADYLVVLAVGLALTVLALAYFDIL
jgi:hypothetical protein